MSGLADVGPVDEVKYHHVGTGVTTSRFFCKVCDGWYGIPHDGEVHRSGHELRARPWCACAPCQQRSGRYPHGGTFATHHDYLAARKLCCDAAEPSS